MRFDPMTVRFALRNLFRQRGRTMMTLASIVFGVVGLILSGGFVEDVFIQLREATIKSRLGHIQIYKDGYLANWTKDPGQYLIEDPARLQDAVESVGGVKATMRRLNFFGLVNNGKTDLPILGEGVESDKEAAEFGDFFFVIEGRKLQADDTYKILLGEGVAKSLNLEVGQFVTILANMPDGGLNSLEFEVAGIFRTFSKDFDARAVRVSLADAQELLAAAGVHAVVVSLADTLATDDTAAKLKTALTTDKLEIKTWFELDDFYRNTVELYQSQLSVLQFIILLVVLLSVANSVNMTAYERVGEFGTLKALGKRSRDISTLIILENCLLGLLGAGAGVLLGAGLAWGISAIGIPMPPPPNSNAGYTAYIRIVPSVLVVSFLIGFVATVLSSLLAARGAARVPVVEALRQNI
jgi:putative ABC transport system permease protein